MEHEARSRRGAGAVRLHARAVSAESLGRRGLDAVLRADGDLSLGSAPTRSDLRRGRRHHSPEPHRAGPQGSLRAHVIVRESVLRRQPAGVRGQPERVVHATTPRAPASRCISTCSFAAIPTIESRSTMRSACCATERGAHRTPRTISKAEATPRKTSCKRRATRPASTCTRGSIDSSAGPTTWTTTKCLAAAGMKLTRDAATQRGRMACRAACRRDGGAGPNSRRMGERKDALTSSRVDELAALADRDHRHGGENDRGGAERTKAHRLTGDRPAE